MHTSFETAAGSYDWTPDTNFRSYNSAACRHYLLFKLKGRQTAVATVHVFKGVKNLRRICIIVE